MFIRTSRLFLRPAWVEDSPAVAAALADAPHAAAAISSVSAGPAARGFIGGSSRVDEPNFLIFARDASSAQLVGAIGFGRPDGKQLELGGWIRTSQQGLGYAGEAARALLELGFEGLRRPIIHARHDATNAAAARLANRLGFSSADGRKGDVVLALTAEAWRESQSVALAA